jgi:NADH:ubiquinone oxidoreductase subunit K
MAPVEHFFFLGALLFTVGLITVIIKRNAVMVLIGIELMLNAANLNLVAFNRINSTPDNGNMFALFVMVVAVCEVAVGLAIILRVYRYYQTVAPDEVSDLKD